MIKPMLASLADAPLHDASLVYEPKYDGIRAIVEAAPGTSARLWSRLGNEKTGEFPELAAELNRLAKRFDGPAVIDGEVVAIDARGRPKSFQFLQNIHRQGSRPGFRPALIAFDLLQLDGRDLRTRPLAERRAALERLLAAAKGPLVRIGEQVRGDGRPLWARAHAEGWEGLIAKRADSRYASGKRTADWRKLKITHEQEFVIGGWTDPRQSRSYFGSLILGVYDGGRLRYVGHVGTGFDEAELARVMTRLQALAIDRCPFVETPPKNERPHWVRPELVAQVRFGEWTNDGILRHPVYLGLRDDKRARDVQREDRPAHPPAARAPLATSRRSPVRADRTAAGASALVDQISALEEAQKNGDLVLSDGDRLPVTNLHKVFWPEPTLTKGDLLRYYVQVAPAILPVVADRPLVMKRSPNGVAAPFFYQHRAPEPIPPGIRIVTLEDDDVPARLVGGNLKTLLYMAQLAAISQDPWFSCVDTSNEAVEAAIDLDPMPGVRFETVLDVARWVRDELDAVGVAGFPKTSGAEGLHVYVPLPPGTPYDTGRIFCQIIATSVAHKHPKAATIVRSVGARGTQVYVDYLQNIRGKTLAAAYSARASDYAGVSTPVTWREIDEGITREDFTIRTMPDRLRAKGDLWAALRKARGINFERVSRKLEAAQRGAAKTGRRR
jgi:bifunctional non-homologous end joining protein LigD